MYIYIAVFYLNNSDCGEKSPTKDVLNSELHRICPFCKLLSKRVAPANLALANETTAVRVFKSLGGALWIRESILSGA